MIKGKVAVVAASSKGLGRAVADALAKEGVNLAICSRNKEEIEKTAKQIRKEFNVDVLPVVCDVTIKSDINLLKEKVIEKYETCHIVFANAGVPPSGKLSSFTNEDYQKAIDLNLMSTINLVYAFLPYMQQQKWGRIIASTSTNVKQLLAGFPLSNVSRIGVVGFIKSVAMEFAPFNITANILAPGDFLTESSRSYIERQAMIEGKNSEDILKRVNQSIPTGKIGDVNDYGALVAFLVSEYASYITSETIKIDGGKYAGLV